MHPRAIAIAGCGPAGMAAALFLTRQGHEVTLFERFEAARPLGSGLLIQPTGRAVLRELGLEDALIAMGSRVDGLVGHAVDSGRRVLDVRYAALAGRCDFGLGVHRASLFAVLHDAVRAAGIRVLTGHEVVDSAVQGNARVLTMADGSHSARFDLVVDTMGARSKLAGDAVRVLPYGALWATVPWPDGGGFDPHALQQRYRRGSVMIGVLPAGRPPGASVDQAAFFWSIRGDKVADWRQAGLNAWKDQVAALWAETAPLLDAIDSAEQLTFAAYAHRTLARPVGDRLIHLGDAWHSTSPQLGQGANMALLDAYALSVAMARHDDLLDALNATIAMRRPHVRRYQAMSHWLTPVYQSDGRILPFLRDRLVGPLSSLRPIQAGQAAMVAGMVGRPLHRLGLTP